MVDKKGAVFVFLSGICWGFGGVCGEYIFRHKGINADILVSYRLLFAGILTLLFCLLAKIKLNKNIFLNKNHCFRLVSFAICGILMCQYTYFYGIELSNAAIATVIQYTAPVFVILFVCFEEKRMINLYETCALILVVLGAFLLATNGDFTKLLLSPKALMVCFLSAVGAAMYALMPRKINSIYHPLPVLGFSMSIAGIVFCIKNQIWLVKINLDLELFLAFVGVIIVGTVMAFGFFMVGLQKVGAARASIIASNEPLAAAIIGYLWIGTTLLNLQIAGFALIMLAIFITMIKKEKH